MKTKKEIKVKFGVALAVAISCLLGCAQEPPKPLEITVWHTELDPDAEEIISLTAREVQEEVARDLQGYVPVISVSGLDWGDLATRLTNNRENPPDLTHLQPFMVYEMMQLYSRPDGHQIYPLDDVIKRIVEKSGQVEEAVLDLHKYRVRPQGKYSTFGLAYAVGTTFIAYRSDWNSAGLPEPKTWEDLIAFGDALSKHASSMSNQPVSAFILPGKSPFFIDQLTNEILVSLGGSLYKDGKPNLTTPELERTLYLLQDIIARTGGQYSATAYRQQFDLFAQGEGAIVPVTYGRATKQIDAVIEKKAKDNSALKQLRLSFAVMPQPGAEATKPGVATIDAEPWVLIAKPDKDPERSQRIKIAERFLERFYERSRYLDFCRKVPVHLRPIFKSMGTEYDSAPYQQNWWHWVAVGKNALGRPLGTAPILMDASGGDARSVEFALSLQRASVIADMVQEAYRPVEEMINARLKGQTIPGEEEARRNAIKQAVSRASIRAEELYKEMP